MHFKLEDKRIIDNNTMDYVILATLVRGINKENSKLIGQETLINHPFLDQLELYNLPSKIGEIKMLENYLDYSALFDKAKQPYKIEKR